MKQHGQAIPRAWLRILRAGMMGCFLLSRLVFAAGPTGLTFVTQDGTYLAGDYAVEPGDAPGALVIFAHGHHEGRNVFYGYMQTGNPQSITQVGTATMTIDYRDDQGFPILQGAYDLIYAARWALLKWPSIQKITLFGASMGGATSGTAISELARPENATLLNGKVFNNWIDVSGVSLLSETALQASLFMPGAVTEIRRDFQATGDSSYTRRSPAMNAGKMKAAGLQQVAIVHARYDGLVTYDQAGQMKLALGGAAIPASLDTLTCASNQAPAGATLFDDAGTVVPSPLATLGAQVFMLLEGCNLVMQRLAGHVISARSDNPAMNAGIQVLRAVLGQ
ncbi:hypothetical protein FPJ27_37185 (plasmid) [Burkholderia sp. MS455]|uniref:alpha/beta hydrolase family protein n=1 Tax=Burkholderia sp. MS455 TaxID=2811788 RepID=UPI00195C9777|nr:hypothetical protein [Burkholderia sp. MS455]QRR07661.1 hypothetical protein FPJ27_15465 [Burkholderia sp. MS455]QRR11833.1 hypothetical protein FPJ27_37185 [Burkholderia sp. MS455]